MDNVIGFPVEDITYITGDLDKGEPTIVGVKTGFGSIELAPDLHDIIVDGNWIKREELIAFILATNIHHDFVKELK